jgi:hypothetical protein
VFLSPSLHPLDVIGKVKILFIIKGEVVNAKGINFVGTLHYSDKSNEGGGLIGAVNHSANHIGEVGAGFFPTRKEVNYLSLARAGLDGRTLYAIEDTCVDVKAVVARCSVKGDDDVVAVFAVSRHSG